MGLMTKLYKFFDSSLFITTKAIALVVIPLILFLLPRNFFDKGQSLCLFTLLTGENCFGCGMTRACMHIIHLDFIGAANFNKIAFIVFPIISILYLQYLFETFKQTNLYKIFFYK